MTVTAPSSYRVVSYDPQGHRMGPLGTLASQISLGLGLSWAMSAWTLLLLPPIVGFMTLLPALGALLLAPKRVIMEFPISISLNAILTIAVGSITWTINPLATTVNIRSLVPAMLAVIIAAGILTLHDLAQGMIWTVRLIVLFTIIALIAIPESRDHLQPDGSVYPGWHGFFNHKNNMTAFMVFAIPTILCFHKPGLVKWGTLGVIAVLLAGSNSATGMTASAFVVLAYMWLRLFQGQRDVRDSTLLFALSILGAVAAVAFVFVSFATITSAYGKDTSLSGRTEIWNASFEALAERPFFGYGFGGLFWSFPPSNDTLALWRAVGFQASHAHNGALDLALQIGLVGLTIFAILWTSTVVSSWRALAERPDLAVWNLCLLSSNLLMSLSEDVFFGGWLAMFGLMKMVLMRREESLRRASLDDGPIEKWAFR